MFGSVSWEWGGRRQVGRQEKEKGKDHPESHSLHVNPLLSQGLARSYNHKERKLSGAFHFGLPGGFLGT